MSGEEGKTQSLMDMQMADLKYTYGVEEDSTAPKKRKSHDEKDAEIAKLYEDCAEYERDLELFESELEVIKAHALEEIESALKEKFPKSDKDYSEELKAVLEAGWKQLVEVQKTHPQEQLDLVQTSSFQSAVVALKTDHAEKISEVLESRWALLVAIKKEHIKEEKNDIKIRGLKPSFAKRIYKQYHGIE